MEPEEQQVAVGDMVVLKSGGHSMMVEKIEDQRVRCVWSDGKTVKEKVLDPRNIAAKPTETKMTIHFTPSSKDIEDLVATISQVSERDDRNRLVIDPDKLKNVLMKELKTPEPMK